MMNTFAKNYSIRFVVHILDCALFRFGTTAHSVLAFQQLLYQVRDDELESIWKIQQPYPGFEPGDLLLVSQSRLQSHLDGRWHFIGLVICYRSTNHSSVTDGLVLGVHKNAILVDILFYSKYLYYATFLEIITIYNDWIYLYIFKLFQS